MPVQVGILIMPRPPLADLIRRCQRYEALGFQSVWLCDHFVDQQLGPLFESWTLLAALAATTSRVRLGIAATCVPFRHPAILAKSATTVDHISGGRVELGLGSGWWQPEFDRFGYDFLPASGRVRQFTATVATLKALFSENSAPIEHPASEVGPAMRPPPVQRPHPPFVLAAQGPRMLDTVARFGDAWLASFGLSAAAVKERNDLLDSRCTAYGRLPEQVRRIFLWAPWVQASDPWRSLASFIGFIDDYQAAGITEFIVDEPRPDQAATFREIVDRALPRLT